MTTPLSNWLSLLERRHPTEIELGLDRVAAVSQRLSLTKPAAQVITVAGTNGKGSCIAVMQSLLNQAGYSTGVYTSPHLVLFNERVVINGVQADDSAFCSAFERIEAACDQQPAISLSYFEFTTLAALILIAEANVDFALLEIGLGGRLDAVNIVDPDIAIVTSIALDHEAWLGTDIDFIGGEKAAIGRAGMPLVYGDIVPVSGVLSEVTNINARLLQNGVDFSFQDNVFSGTDNDGEVLRFDVGDIAYPPASIGCALEALTSAGINLANIDIANCLNELMLPGRFQTVAFMGREMILDVAHNPAAAHRLADLLQNRQPNRRVVAIFSIMADKDISATVEPLLPLVDHWLLPQLADSTRAANPQSLQALLYNAGENSEQTDSIETALTKAVNQTRSDDLILVCGSFYLVGPVLQRISMAN